MAAAEQVAAGSGLPADGVLDVLTRLADKSLLRVDRAGEEMRYHLLATVRDYARERLTAAGEYDQARQAHVRFYADFVEHIEPRIGGDDARGEVDLERDERELNRIEVETPNIRAALEFARSAGDMAGALRITGPLERYAYLRGQYSEVRRWMDSAVTIGPDAPTMLLAKALLGSGRLAHLQCDYATAVRRLEAALRLYQELDDPHGIARALQGLGSVAREQGRYDRSLELHAEGLAIAEAAGDNQAVATAHNFLGFASWLRGDYDALSPSALWPARGSRLWATWRASSGRCSASARSRASRAWTSGPPAAGAEPAPIGGHRVPRGRGLGAGAAGPAGGRPR